MQKWNYRTKKYEDYEVNPERNTPLVAEDMCAKVNCVSCGEVNEYGSYYTSRTIHNQIGLGFAVCKSCYAEETKNYYKSLKENEK